LAVRLVGTPRKLASDSIVVAFGVSISSTASSSSAAISGTTTGATWRFAA
jgi:hypothetical protein